MEWAYIQIASLAGLVSRVLFIAAADHRLNKAKRDERS